MLLFALAMWGLSRYYPLGPFVAPSWGWLGRCVIAMALLALLTAFIQFRRAGTTVNPHRPEATTRLVTSGLYAWSRNPMYLSLAVLLLGWAVTLGALSAMLGPLLFVPLMQYVQIEPEERALRRRFGRNYEEYCYRVNRWLGRKRSATSPGHA
jgi:protein-S-isoprenylcysteine O-methyltransferase Ste14